MRFKYVYPVQIRVLLKKREDTYLKWSNLGSLLIITLLIILLGPRTGRADYTTEVC